MTAGILVPALVMSQFNLLQVGLVLSVGAMCVSGTDSAGPIHHRRIGMMVCNIAIFVVSLAVGFTTHSPALLGIILFVFCFFFSMLGIFGARATSIGLAALLVMILNIDHKREGWDVVWNTLYLLAGGTWYMLFSLFLYSVLPYKLAQQALGDFIQSVAEYFRARTGFYDKQADYSDTYKSLLQQQIVVQEKQDLITELLFKTPDIVKESTTTGRILIMIYLDAADLFERVMTSYQDYNTLHSYFYTTGILQKFGELALELAQELDKIGIAVKSGRASVENPLLSEHIHVARTEYNQLRKTFLNPENIEGFISLNGILENMQDIADRLHTLHHYSTYDRKLSKAPSHKLDYKKFVSHQDITPQIFIDNISFQSNMFRHSFRVSIAVLAGYLISLFFKFGHSYWILLTIIVILKPAYSLTKKRNADRLIGTVCGVLIGILILFLIKNNTALLIIMILLMATTYTFIRNHYLVAVLFMTPYIIIFFHLLYPDNFKMVLTDRVIDTGIGSLIAFIASIFLVPAWERTTIITFMIQMLEDNRNYYNITANVFGNTEPIIKNQHQVARKNALVSLANLSDAFNRMLSEPKRKQIGIDKVHQFVVLNHMLTSHIATLSYYIQSRKTIYRSEKFIGVSNDTSNCITNAIDILKKNPSTIPVISNKDSLRLLNEQANMLLETRKKELQQGQLETTTKKYLLELKSVVNQFNFIYKIVVDINKAAGCMK